MSIIIRATKKIKRLTFEFLNREKIISHRDIAKYLKMKDPVILEAGACDGFDTKRFAQDYRRGKIYAFEPVSNVFAMLKKTVAKYSNVKIYNLALSDENGFTEININEVGNTDAIPGSSTLNTPESQFLQLYPDMKFNRTERIQTKTLDTWAEEEGIDKIDFMWLDMEGMEYRVLKASNKILKTVKVLYTEFTRVPRYENDILYSDYRKWIEEQGFILVKEETLYESGGNMLFIRNI